MNASLSSHGSNERSVQDLKDLAAELRCRMVEYSGRTKTPHLASCLSCADILAVSYFDRLNIDPADPTNVDRDRFILSKGHAAPALFQVLSMAGFFPEQDLLEASHDGTGVFGEHPPKPGHLPGIEAATGSLGHGLPIAVGMMLAARVKGQSYCVNVLLGDGESNEGSIWEAAMFAGAQKLDKLTVIVDFNKWQATDRSQAVMAIDPMADKWRSFNWNAQEVDGHDVAELRNVLSAPRDGRPLAVIAHTVKGKGISFMEDDNNWHYKTPSSDEVDVAIKELRAGE